MKRFSRLWGAHWQTTVLIFAAVVLVGSLELARLSSIVQGLSQSEIAQQQFSSSWHHLASNPLYLPLTSLEWLSQTLTHHHGALVSRLPSVFFGLLTLAALTYVLRRWYGRRTSLYGIVLFACSAWFLHISRSGTTDILYLGLLPFLLALQLLWERHTELLAIQILVPILLALILYIPGAIWFVILGVILQPHLLTDAWEDLSKWQSRLLVCGIFVVCLIPLGLAFVQHPDLLRTWIGLPRTFDTPLHIVKRLGLSVSYLFYRGPRDPALWLDRTPVLGIFSVVMLLLGIFFYIRHLAAPRTRQLIGLFIVGSLLFALQGPVTYSVIIPLAYFGVVAGIGYLLHEWLHTFPRNPLARSIGYGLLAIAIILACAYNLRSYYVAWPHSQATLSAFHHR